MLLLLNKDIGIEYRDWKFGVMANRKRYSMKAKSDKGNWMRYLSDTGMPMEYCPSQNIVIPRFTIVSGTLFPRF